MLFRSAGNPQLALATRNVRLRSISEIGKTKEHLRLTVEDEAGSVKSILWWGGAGAELPENDSNIDIAYSVRASTFRGEKQVALRFEDFRVVKEKAIEIPPTEIKIMDWRPEIEKFESLGKDKLIWAEGADKARGASRFELTRAEELVIYTTPCSPAELNSALEQVKPRLVYLIAVSPASQTADEFLSSLAGMAKYAIKNKSGKASIQELASATAQRESAVRIGLEWLAAGSHVSVSREDDAVILSAGSGESNHYLQKELYTAVRGILEETAAYRSYFSRARVENLIGGA